MANLDYPTYADLESLGAASKLVVRGRFITVVKRDFERAYATGGDPNQQGLPIAVWEFRIDEKLKGPNVGASIQVLVFDTQRVQMTDETEVAPGAEVVVFLARQRNGAWARAGGGQAVLDVAADGTLKAHRGAEVGLARQAAKTKAADVGHLLKAR